MTTSRKKRHNRWDRELKKYLAPLLIDYCEVQLPGCERTMNLTPAHSRKRSKIETKEQYFEVVCACGNCHRLLDEKMSHEEMEQAVKSVIRNRDVTI